MSSLRQAEYQSKAEARLSLALLKERGGNRHQKEVEGRFLSRTHYSASLLASSTYSQGAFRAFVNRTSFWSATSLTMPMRLMSPASMASS
jgi:hypothetical protein